MENRSFGKSTDQQQTRVASGAVYQPDSAPPRDSFQISPPSISLPKGGGAIRGIGEKFAANPVTGTGSMTVPIPTSPGRSGFGPQLSLSYDSGAGNGPFGFGWSLSLPAITRKTEKGLPKYLDGYGQGADSDVFILSGSEDLVPEFEKDVTGNWVIEDDKYVVHDKPRTVDGITYRVRRYRPRIEGLFARIERWTNKDKPEHTFWRSISKDNITTWYGKTAESRIQDPADPSRIFSWLICESYDDKGNVMSYGYKDENSGEIDTSQAHERNRSVDSRKSNRYLKHLRYGNHDPYFPRLEETAPWPIVPESDQWYFHVVFDYADCDSDVPKPSDDMEKNADGSLEYAWKPRPDPFSTYRAGFEVRTYRLCQRVLMFHHFPGEDNVGKDCLVRSTDFNYEFEDDPKIARAPIYSFLTSVTQSGYVRQGERYLKKSFPPVEFTYSKPEVQEVVEEIDPETLENFPIGLDGSVYQWTDLHGEGIPGILTEQGGAWFYKRNWSPVPDKLPDGSEVVKAKFSALETVALKPNMGLNGGAQFMDLAGDGQPDLVVLDDPMPGLYEHDLEEGWEPFRPFTSRLNRDMRDPNLKFVDLDGDGHGDVLITEDDAFVWHESLLEEGFGPAQRVAQWLDEDKGPRIVFDDGTQSIYLADMSGDGLTDLVRIRNGEFCYWPNLGYGQFGAKVTMDQSPHFDHSDLFDQKRIRLADINGSGTTDIIYLHRDGIRLYFNQSGNSWSQPHTLKVFPRIDDLVSIVPVDLLGNGTACLVWSSPLPGDARRPMRYVNLMGGHKPHLLVKTINNLGAETLVDYAPSTKFYLQDKRDGKPWITKLPFPVHVVERVTVTDKWRKTEFSSTYSYHHGYFDGIEREFRGFGRVEQVDTEDYGTFAKGNKGSPYITDDQKLYQPPVKTITWYHTGAAVERQRILSSLKQEYFIVPGFTEHELPQPTLTPADLSAEEWREALRACKGMVLRQEVFELDVDKLNQDMEKPVRLYSTAYHNSNIICLQRQNGNRHAAFLVTESEAITYNYELDLEQKIPRPDPRIAHTLNLHFDKYGRAVQSVAVNYPRLVPYADPADLLTTEQRQLIRNVQSERHIGYTETHFTDELPEDPDRHRLPAPCEVLTYELTGAKSTTGFSPSAGLYFSLEDLKDFALSEILPDQGPKSVVPLAYHEQATGDREKAHKRIVEWVRVLYFTDDLSGPLDFGQPSRLGLTYETYKLALTRDLLKAVLDTKLTTQVFTNLNTPPISGYIPGTALSSTLANQWWIRSGIAGFARDPIQHFYLPDEYTDPFGNKTRLAYDGKYDLFIQSSTDALGNKSGIATVRSDPADPSTERPRFDYRVLAPIEMVDPNGNHTEVYFDVLGMVVASAVKGKGTEADNLNGYTDTFANPDLTTILDFFDPPPLTAEQASARFSPILGNATSRFLYHFGERSENGNAVWGDRPACACTIVRERHMASIATGDLPSPLQIAFECSDGMGSVLMKRIQAEPEQANGPLRWIVSGKIVLNNKGKPVKQYEPYFSNKAKCCANGDTHDEVGVTNLMYYDAAGRLIRTEMPDGTYSRIEFSPWHMKTFDANDTAYDPDPNNPNHSDWYRRRTDPTHPLYATFDTTEDNRAAEVIKAHANTPAQVHLDSLGREVIAIAHNRTNGVDEKYLTFTKLDAEGKPLWICDARGNLVMQYITPPKSNHTPLYDEPNPDWRPAYDMPSDLVSSYDIAGNLLFQHSMDAGDRWMLMDATGKPMLAWDLNETPPANGATRQDRFYRTDYDALHRPKAQWLTINTDAPILAERYEYQDAVLNDTNNLNGQLVCHYDPSGLVEVVRRDFKRNMQEVRRRLVQDAQTSVIDWQGNTAGKLERQVYVQRTEYDALNRMTRLENWHRLGTPGGIYTPYYNERGVLKSETFNLRGTITNAVKEIRYNVKGQKKFLALGNGTLSQYDYDTTTFRLRQIRTTRPGDASEFPQRRSGLRDARIVQQLLYTYDPMGNITEIEDQAYKPVFFGNGIAESKSHYIYDALYRLISATGRETADGGSALKESRDTTVLNGFPVTDQTLRSYAQTYEYDSVGNILTMRHSVPSDGASGWTRVYRNDTNSNRLLSTQQGTITTDYRYDTHGNMLNLMRTNPQFNMHWDHRDMIRSINLGGGGIAYYQYDVNKQRTRKRVEKLNGSSGYRESIYLGGYEVYRRYNGDGITVVEEIESHSLFEGEQRVLLVDDVIMTNKTHTDGRAYRRGPIYRYQYCNHLGSAYLELDHEAEIISYEEYHPYGTCAYQAMRQGIEAPLKRYRYTGVERDEESGLGYHGSRYYLSWLARWISSDPIGLGGGDNFYSYVSARPLLERDRTGMAGDPVDYFAAGKKWEDEILTTLESKFKVVRQVTVKAIIDGKEVTSVLDALSKTKDGWAVFESKLNPTTALSEAQEKLMAHIERGGQFTLAAGTEKEKLLGEVLGLSDKTSIAATQYLVLHQGNASQVLQGLEAIGSGEMSTIAKGGELIVLTRSEAAEAYKLVQANQGMFWKDAVSKVRGTLPGIAITALASLVLLSSPAQAATSDATAKQSDADTTKNVVSTSERAGLLAMAAGGLASAAGKLLDAPKLAEFGGGLMKYGGYLTAPLTLYQGQKDIRSGDPFRQITGSLDMLGIVLPPAGIFALELRIMEPGFQLFNEMIVRKLGSMVPLGIGR